MVGVRMANALLAGDDSTTVTSSLLETAGLRIAAAGLKNASSVPVNPHKKRTEEAWKRKGGMVNASATHRHMH